MLRQLRLATGSRFPYQTVTDELRSRIVDRNYPPGLRLPSVEELASEFGVSTITIRRAIRDLSLEGLVTGRQGLGNFIVDKQRIVRACAEVERSLLFATLIMVTALIPLFTMTGPEGQIFGPMADTYAFALGGALLLAVTVSPVLCFLLLRRLKPARENLLVRAIKAVYLWQLRGLLAIRWPVTAAFVAATATTSVSHSVLISSAETEPNARSTRVSQRNTFGSSCSSKIAWRVSPGRTGGVSDGRGSRRYLPPS